MYIGVVIDEFHRAIGTLTEGNIAEENRIPALYIVISVLACKGLHSCLDIVTIHKLGTELTVVVKFEAKSTFGIIRSFAHNLRAVEYPLGNTVFVFCDLQDFVLGVFHHVGMGGKVTEQKTGGQRERG